MTNAERISQLEKTVLTLANTLDLSVTRIGWLRSQVKQTASNDELAAERTELLAIMNIADNGGPADKAMAKQVLHELGCAAPDVLPSDVTDPCR